MGFAREVADKVVFMDAGAVVEVAKPMEFFHQSAKSAWPALSPADSGARHPMTSVNSALLEIHQHEGLSYKPLVDFANWRVAIP